MRTRQWKSPSKHPQSPTFSNVPKFDPGRCRKTEKGPISVNAACATLVFDGECAICRSWVSYWQRLTNGRVIYRPYQEAAADFPTLRMKPSNARDLAARAGRANLLGSGTSPVWL